MRGGEVRGWEGRREERRGGREAKGGEGEGTGGFICILLADVCRRWLKIRLILAKYKLHMYAVAFACSIVNLNIQTYSTFPNIVYTYQIRLM